MDLTYLEGTSGTLFQGAIICRGRATSVTNVAKLFSCRYEIGLPSKASLRTREGYCKISIVIRGHFYSGRVLKRRGHILVTTIIVGHEQVWVCLQ